MISCRVVIGATLLVAALPLLVVVARPFRTAVVMATAPTVGLDLGEPDALIRTDSLPQLPRDLLRVPMFRDALTEDFVFYYEQNEVRLSLSGTLRRLAYEHDLDLGDRLIKSVIDEPAEVALWKGPDGRLTYSLVAITRNGLAKTLEAVARAALTDRYLKKLGDGLVVDGDRVPLYALTYTYRKTLVFAGRGDRLVVASDPGMLTDESGKLADRARGVLTALLAKDADGHAVHRRRFSLGQPGARHTVAVTGRYVSFGYQRFFPSGRALRFDFDRDRWATQILLDPRAIPADGFATSALWSLMPTPPTACAALPVDWQAAVTLLPPVGADEQRARGFADAPAGPAGVCWYPSSRLHTPVFVVPVKRAPSADEIAMLGTVFGVAIGAREAGLSDQRDPRFPVLAPTLADGSRLWQRRVTSSDHSTLLPTLALHARAVVFSPDNRLVDDVLEVAGKKFPALRDSLPATGAALAVVTPSSLSALAEKETFASLPATHEPVFRNAASAHLIPKLAALKRYPAYALVVPGDGRVGGAG